MYQKYFFVQELAPNGFLQVYAAYKKYVLIFEIRTLKPKIINLRMRKIKRQQQTDAANIIEKLYEPTCKLYFEKYLKIHTEQGRASGVIELSLLWSKPRPRCSMKKNK